MESLQVKHFQIRILRKNVKNVNLRLYPKNGEIRVTAHRKVPQDFIKSFILSKLNWIEERLDTFKSLPPVVKPQYINGEIHRIWGEDHLLNLDFPQNASHAEREKIFYQWSIKLLNHQIETEMQKWIKRLGLPAMKWSVRKTRTRWGSYSLQTKRISLSWELIKRPQYCLDYVVLHELTHVFVPHHGPQFKKILDQQMPNWRQIQNELRRLI